MSLWQKLTGWFRFAEHGVGHEEAEGLRLEFQSRYLQFKLLLTANRQALAIMAELEKALVGDTPFGMQFLRSRSMDACTRVYQMVNHLHAIAPDKYRALDPQLESIRHNLDQLVNPVFLPDRQGPLILPVAALDRASIDQAGLKMAHLGVLGNHMKLPVPDGFVVTTRAFDHFLEANDLRHEIRRRLQIAEGGSAQGHYAISAEIRSLIQAAPLPPDLEEAIHTACRDLAVRTKLSTKALRLAVRSSAINEDREGASFAGLYHSALNIRADHLIETYKQIVAAAYSPAVMAYCYNRGRCDENNRMAVGVLQMVEAVCSGVAYSANPVDPRDPSVIINAAWGLPKAVVDGATATDLFHVTKTEPPAIGHQRIAHKEKKYICNPDEGVCRLDDTGDACDQASLTEPQAVELARLAMRLESSWGRPQDIEWAIDETGRTVLLQCRALPLADNTESAWSGVGDPEDLPEPLFRGGMTVSAGVAAGPVFVVRKEVDAMDFPDGAVLVTDRALARWAALLPRAAAVISEAGGMTGHLASVAREFKVPALFGAAGVIDHLTNGMSITMDADTAQVYDQALPALLAARQRQPATPIMHGTPVHATLQQVAQQITPLNLVNPDSPEFAPDHCRTLHDITRFCHEKSVHEMFRFGKTHRFPERSSKQLRARIPMQWWVLNLDDGFIHDATDKRYIDLENIACQPMLDLWAGITAYPWDGPPPMDGRGFASVMFRATQNQALLPTVRTTMNNRNYFMISRHYCSLQSRLGFHFAITEALVSERTSENYIRFEFKGGAADLDRRRKRVVLVKELLEIHGFATEVTQDTLRARIEQYDAPVMADKLKVLGYLTIHTRQLDMVMANAAMREHYRKRLLDQMEAMLSGKTAADNDLV